MLLANPWKRPLPAMCSTITTTRLSARNIRWFPKRYIPRILQKSCRFPGGLNYMVSRTDNNCHRQTIVWLGLYMCVTTLTGLSSIVPSAASSFVKVLLRYCTHSMMSGAEPLFLTGRLPLGDTLTTELSETGNILLSTWNSHSPPRKK